MNTWNTVALLTFPTVALYVQQYCVETGCRKAVRLLLNSGGGNAMDPLAAAVAPHAVMKDEGGRAVMRQRTAGAGRGVGEELGGKAQAEEVAHEAHRGGVAHFLWAVGGCASSSGEICGACSNGGSCRQTQCPDLPEGACCAEFDSTDARYPVARVRKPDNI